MLYKKNNNTQLSMDLFKNPTSEYRGAPFWAWNCVLSKDELLWQIEQLKKMGFGGFHMHARSGLTTKYLGNEFMELIQTCTEKAQSENMLAWLYDEDRWPSGTAGGYVTKSPENRAKYLVFSTTKPDWVSKNEGIKNGKPYLISCFDIVLNADGTLKSFNMISDNDKAVGCKWYAYVRTPDTRGWHNNQTYVDTMSKTAMDEFINITYEAYKRSVGKQFGGTVPAIFTDEPQTTFKTTLAFAADKSDVNMPWTTDFDKIYKDEYKLDIISHLPELIWDLPDNRPSKFRYFYHDLVCELFTRAFADNCGKWCKDNNIALTGHMMEEPTLDSQTHAIGEAMRAYRSFGIPGIDMLCDQIELSTAKQAQSACHQYGKEGVLSELYGVTNWTFDFRGHKFQGDWQAALGVTVRVPHLSWVSMKGSAKRDYPASIHYQSPWYKEYPYIEDHFSRLNTVLTRGKPIVNVGVIHPIESYWLNFGPSENTAAMRNQLEENFSNIINWLLFGTIDFDFISEALLPSQYNGCSEKKLSVGKMQYSAIIVSGCQTLRSSTADILIEFAKSGGRVIFAGDMLKYINCEQSDKVNTLYSLSEHIDTNRISLLEKLSDVRNVLIRNSDASITDNLIYQMREDGNVKWLFIAHAKKAEFFDNINRQDISIHIKGKFEPIIYNTITGEKYPAVFHIENGTTIITHTLYANDSLLLELKKPSVNCYHSKKTPHKRNSEIRILNNVQYTREEQNVYLLDMAQYSLDEGKTYSSTEEILRIDYKIRQELNYPLADGRDCQPWTIPSEPATQFPWLKFKIESDIETQCLLAYEEAEEVILNGEIIAVSENGFFVDHSIKTMELSRLKCGINELLIRVPIAKRISIENFFLLGDFDVTVRGCSKKITAPSRNIGFGTITNQGMPFYGGNITYKTKINIAEKGNLSVCINYYRGSLIRVSLDGRDKGIIAFDPFSLDLGIVTAGEHTVEFTLFGNRANTFGALHYCGDKMKSWNVYSPEMWYTNDDEWSYEYQLFDTGIMSSPIFKITK